MMQLSVEDRGRGRVSECHPHRTSRSLFLALLTLGCTLPLGAPAAVITWTDAAGGQFNDAANWGAGGPPGVADEARFNIGSATYTVDLTTNVTNERLVVRRDDVTLDLAANIYDLTAVANRSVAIATTGSNVGSLTLLNGTVNAVEVATSFTANSVGTLTVGMGATLNASSDVIIGEAGTGFVNVEDGGEVNGLLVVLGELAGASGSAVVTGAGSTLTTTERLRVGDFGTGALTIAAGATVTTGFGVQMGISTGGDGSVIVTGGGSTLDADINLVVGDAGTGALTVIAGAAASAGDDLLIGGASGNGTVTVTGSGSSLSITDEVALGWGLDGTGGLLVEDGATITSSAARIGEVTGGTGMAAVTGAGSTWANTATIVGDSGEGTLLVDNGGAVVTLATFVGSGTGSVGEVFVTGTGSTWTSNGSFYVGALGSGTFDVDDGNTVTVLGRVNIAVFNGSSGTLTVSGAGTTFRNFSDLIVGNGSSGTLLIETGAEFISGLDAADQSHIGGLDVDTGVPVGMVTVTGAGSGWFNFADLTIGGGILGGSGTLIIADGGRAENPTAILGDTFGSSGAVTVTDADSLWTNTDTLIVGNDGSGTLLVAAGGTVSSDQGQIGATAQGDGTVTATGGNSTWTNTDVLYVGGDDTAAGGAGALIVETGATVDAGNLLKLWGPGTVHLNGGTIRTLALDITAGSFNFNGGTLNFADDLTLGASGPLGTSYALAPQRHLAVDDVTTIDIGSTLSIDGGTFTTSSLVADGVLALNAGTFNLTGDDLTVGSFGLFGATLHLTSNQAVNITNTTTVNNGALLLIENGSFSAGTTINNGQVTLDGVASALDGATLTNNSLVSGNGRIGATLDNTAAGEVRVGSGDTLTFSRTSNVNDGTIDLLGGTIEFTRNFDNNAGGSIVGRGTLITAEGMTNAGTVALSGATEILGDVSNLAGGTIIISGNSTLTFFDDVVHDGVEIRVSEGSAAVYFGAYSGTGPLTGTGTNFFEGDLNPGSSPGRLYVEGDAVLGLSNTLSIELAGLLPGDDFESVEVLGDLTLGGTLDIDLLGDYLPAIGDSYTFITAVGGIDGVFDSYLLPRAQGVRFDIEYLSHAVVLRTAALPLPGAMWLLLSALGGLVLARPGRGRATDGWPASARTLEFK